jgi:hypothetical protein
LLPGGMVMLQIVLCPVPRQEQVHDAMVALQIWAAERDLDIGPDSNLPWWDGAVPDYDMAVSSLLSPG